MAAPPPGTSARTILVMATYNAEPYLREQLQSIQQQTVTDWTLLVRDDGSSDGTRAMLAAAQQDDARIEILEDDLGRLGPIGNFGRLATVALERGAERMFFADQDDLWMPDKMARLLEALSAAERRYGASCPIVAHSDLRLIDGSGAPITPSFMRFQRIHHEPVDPLRTLLVQNFVTGCASVVNRALLTLALPVPDTVPMHDWWFALCAAAAGTIAWVPDVTVSYRRHTSNTVPVRGFWRTMNPVKTDWGEVWRIGRRTHRIAVQQAGALLRRLVEHHAGHAGSCEVIRGFLSAHGQLRPWRVWQIHALGIRCQTLPRRLALYARVYCDAGPVPEIAPPLPVPATAHVPRASASATAPH